MEQNQKPVRYEIIDTHTGSVVATAQTVRSAFNAAERRNQAYGAHRYSRRAVWA